VGSAATVGADQNLPADPSAAPSKRQLPQSILGNLDVVGSGVGTGPALTEHHRQRLTRPIRSVVHPRSQRMKPEAPLERWCRQLLFRVRGDQRGVQVDHQRPVPAHPKIGGIQPRHLHTRSRTIALAWLIAANAAVGVEANASTSRDTVGSEATRPNTAGSDRNTEMSARQSPPTATLIAVAFAVLTAARLPLLPPSRAGPLTTLQVCPSCCGPHSCSPLRAFDTGLRPRPFPTEAASLLPGHQSATRTGLTPASDDEHEPTDHPDTRSPPVPLGARKIEANGG